MKVSFVYILRRSDCIYYTGITSNLEKRIEEHIIGKYPQSYTFKRRPVELVFYTEFTDVNLAIEKEKQIKSWFWAKKEALVESPYDDLSNLAKKKFR
jgi:putative endonuclease